MGRKGVSKRKSSKTKAPSVSSASKNGAVSSLTKAAETRAPESIGKGEAIAIGKGGKKKSSDSVQNHKKR